MIFKMGILILLAILPGSFVWAKPQNYRVVLLDARILPVNEQGNCWDLCSRRVARELKSIADRLAQNKTFTPKAVRAAFAAATREPNVYLKGSRMPDPYAVVHFRHQQMLRSQPISDTLFPRWGASEQVMLGDVEHVTISVWDKDLLKKDDLIGQVGPIRIPSIYLKQGGIWRLRFQQVFEFRMLFVPLPASAKEKFQPGLYRILVHGATIAPKKPDGRNWDAFRGLPDPYAVLIIGKHRFQTPVVPNTLSPQWSFFTQVYLQGTERFIYQVYDKDINRDDLIGSCTYQQISHLIQRYQKHYRHQCQSILSIHLSFERVMGSTDTKP